MRKISVLLTVLLVTCLAFAEGTHTWQQKSFEDFEKGTAKGIAVRSNGALELAPGFKAIATSPSTYIWSLATDAQGNVYAAAGSPARVYRITPSGQITIIFQPQELQVQSLEVDSKGVIYAATSPDGKVYRIERRATDRRTPSTAPKSEGAVEPLDPSWTSSVLFEPKTKYIWDLALAKDGTLYIATGDRGEIFRVKNGQGSLFFKSDEAHIRSLALDPQGNLIAGSDGSGLIYRISPAGEAFVLYSAPKKEITALAVDPSGNIYAAGVGEKRAGAPSQAPAPGAMSAIAPSAAQSGKENSVAQSMNPSAAMAPGVAIPGSVVVGGSEIYQLAPDGSPKRLWASREDVVYALALDGHGQLLAGTGNRGKVFSISSDTQFTDLLKASATQVTAFTTAPNGGLYVSTSNLGKLFLLAGAPDAEGTFESDVFDARIFSRWGRADVRGSGNFELWARSGNVDNPDRNWSPWNKVDLTRETPVAVPSARFIQWKAVMRPGPHPAHIDSVLINFLPKNVAPEVDDVGVQVGWKYPMSPRSGGDMGSTGSAVQLQRFDQQPNAVRDRTSIAIHWASHDDNDDQLVYSVYYRGDNEQNWKLLKDKLYDHFLSFDAGLLPDGAYTVKVVVSDAPSHSPDESLLGEQESDRFEIDTTPPQVQFLNAAVESDQLHITFRALDGFSDIRRAEYSVDGGEWQYVEPVGHLSDYRVENYDFAIPVPGGSNVQVAAGPATENRGKRGKAQASSAPVELSPRPAAEHLVAVRIYDKFDNVGVAKTVLRTTGIASAAAQQVSGRQ